MTSRSLSQKHIYTHTQERAHKTFLTALALFLQNVTARVDIINCHGLIPLHCAPPSAPTPFSLHAFIPHPNQPGGEACVRPAHL